MFIPKAAVKYAFSKSSSQRTSSILIIVSIAVAIMAVLVTMAVMNGLQSDQIRLLRNIESFDLIVKNTNLTKKELTELTNSECYEFAEVPVLLNDNGTMRLRAYESSFFKNDKCKSSIRFNSYLSDGIAVSGNVLSVLNTMPGKETHLTLLKKGKTAALVPFSFSKYIKSIYFTELSDFSMQTVIAELDSVKDIFNESSIQVGIYSNENPEKIKKIILDSDASAQVVTWKEYNNTLYSALVLEKALMYLFLFCIFLIISIGLKNSTLKLINSKSREGAILKALGLERNKIMSIFITQGIIISLSGIVIGSAAGLLFINNIHYILGFLSKLSGSLYLIDALALKATIGHKEILFIDFTVFLTMLAFVIYVSKRTYKDNVLEVLRNVGN